MFLIVGLNYTNPATVQTTKEERKIERKKEKKSQVGGGSFIVYVVADLKGSSNSLT